MHMLLHFLIPALASALLNRGKKLSRFTRIYLVMMSAMLVDLDHLLATPIYDPLRCSIGFHPLHSLLAISLYGLLCCFSKTRWLGLGLIIHMALDSIDCQYTNGVWFT